MPVAMALRHAAPLALAAGVA
ncbi:protein of unknown function [Burkholderia multivorans]